MAALRLTGEVVERQTYLNGTSYLLIEGVLEPDQPFFPQEAAWSLAVTLPKAEGSPIEEGDFTLAGPNFEWLAGVEAGGHGSETDESTGATVLKIWLTLLTREGVLPGGIAGAVGISLELRGSETSGELRSAS